MRFELSGIIARVDPQVIIFESSGDFDTAGYLDLGYTNFDVICIGGGGGRGGGVDTANTGTLIRTYGGEGGGGGFHRVQGVLSALPSTCPVVVGAAGAPGVEQSNPANVGSTTDGSDGSYSSFNTNFCQASGGKGGKRAQTVSTTANPLADGGEGGIGNRTAVGGGGLGGHCGDPDDDPSTSTDGEDGPIIDNIGHGGGGGAGAISKYDGTSYLEATGGGHGSWLPDNLLVAGDAEDPQTGGTGVDQSKPGRGGGATARPLSGLPYNYGQAGVQGAVVVYLAAG